MNAGLERELDATPRGASASRQRTSSVRLGSLPQSSSQDLRLIQDRLAMFAAAAFFITVTFFAAMTGLDLGLADGQGFQAPLGRVCHGLATLSGFAVWRIARSRRLYSPEVLTWLDGLGTLCICGSFAAMGHFSGQPYGFYTALLAIIHVNVGRASLVPSVALRTLCICAASLCGVVLSRALLPLPPGTEHESALRLRWVLEAALWSGAGTGVATLASQVIYGLHEKALEARRLGQYDLEEKIGQGGMGEIYRARHAMLRRPTAVKLVSGSVSEERLRRFEKEVQLTARLTHPNTISIYDYGRTPDGTFYYAMELLEGLTVEQLVERHGPQSPERVIHLLEQACGALAEAHAEGLIHRDIKPANLYLCRRGGQLDVVKVLDFGLVRELPSESGNEAHASLSNVDTVVGTPLYLSPEAILSPERVDARADLYGLGGVAYFMLTGTAPFGGRSLVEICSHHLHTAPERPSERLARKSASPGASGLPASPPPANEHSANAHAANGHAAPHGVPPDLERLVLRCLAKEPDARFTSAMELSNELRRCDAAGAWSASRAETWWAAHHEPRREPPPAPAPSIEAPCLTVCPLDLRRRFQERKAGA